MIEARLLFGNETVDVQLPDRARRRRGGRGGPGGPRLGRGGDEGAAVGGALWRPLGLPRLGEMVKPGDSVLIAFDDPTVPSFGPVRRLAIEAVLEEMAAAGGSAGAGHPVSGTAAAPPPGAGPRPPLRRASHLSRR